MNSSFKNNQEAYSRMKNFILRSFPLSTQLTQSYERKKEIKKNKQTDDYRQMFNNLSCFWTPRTENLYIF